MNDSTAMAYSNDDNSILILQHQSNASNDIHNWTWASFREYMKDDNIPLNSVSLSILLFFLVIGALLNIGFVLFILKSLISLGEEKGWKSRSKLNSLEKVGKVTKAGNTDNDVRDVVVVHMHNRKGLRGDPNESFSEICIEEKVKGFVPISSICSTRSLIPTDDNSDDKGCYDFRDMNKALGLENKEN